MKLKLFKQFLADHPDIPYELIRIYLGLGLFAKGIYFTMHVDQVSQLLQSGPDFFLSNLIPRYVGLAHLAGGLMLAIGILTRLAALAQIPVLVGAIIFVHLPTGLFTSAGSLEFSILVLFLLCLIVYRGGGRYSADQYIDRDHSN